ncbi:hypothetical protein DL764_004093 [Monosporascus ibericus]|uniref:Pectate lyase superfamily protein domain-containing protein n=1 Tax=Monosporascus ibericus TaxID=155417 RepID=A0A4Q4TEP4_9PEZI|nr:hypothetical protein DL764_004093 [Monosporascus ibericus]
MDKAAKSPGDIVYVPPGLYTIGNLLLRNQTFLNLAGGSVLKFTGNPADYKSLYTKLDLGPDTWWIRTEFNSTGINVYGRGTIDVGDSSFWAVTPIQVEEATITNLKILNRFDVTQDDGIDVVESTKVTVTFQNNVVYSAVVGMGIDHEFGAATASHITFRNTGYRGPARERRRWNSPKKPTGSVMTPIPESTDLGRGQIALNKAWSTEQAKADCVAAQAAYGATKATVLITVVADAPTVYRTKNSTVTADPAMETTTLGLHEHADLISVVTQTPQAATTIVAKRLNKAPDTGASASASASVSACAILSVYPPACAAPSDYFSASACFCASPEQWPGIPRSWSSGLSPI